MSAPRASIVLPTLNGERDLARLLPALERQAFEGGLELCAIDSSSSDSTRELLVHAGASVVTIPQPEFRHGATRNACAARARGEFLVFLSQDAEPANDQFLAHLLAPFADPKVAGTYSRLLPHPSDDPLTRRTALDAPEASAQPRYHDHRFNNVASAIRASVFRELPFPDVTFGEDLAWAELADAAGWRIAFAPESVVFHAHRYTLAAAYARYYVDAAFHREHYGRRIRPNVFSALRGFAHEVRADARFIAHDAMPGAWKYMWRSPCLRGAQVLGQWMGSNGKLRR